MGFKNIWSFGQYRTAARNLQRSYRRLRFFFQIRYRYLLIQKADTERRYYYIYEPLRADIITASPISAAHAAVRSISL